MRSGLTAVLIMALRRIFNYGPRGQATAILTFGATLINFLASYSTRGA